MSSKVSEILKQKRLLGPTAFLWAHEWGDVLLYRDVQSSVDDDGKNAVKRWLVDQNTISKLIKIGAIDNE